MTNCDTMKSGVTMSLLKPTIISRLADRHIGSPEEVVPAGSSREDRDRTVLWWGEGDTPRAAKVVYAGVPAPSPGAVAPARPGVTVPGASSSSGEEET